MIFITAICPDKKTKSLEDIQLEGYEWNKKRYIFSYPRSSADLYMWELQEEYSQI